MSTFWRFRRRFLSFRLEIHSILRIYQQENISLSSRLRLIWPENVKILAENGGSGSSAVDLSVLGVDTFNSWNL